MKIQVAYFYETSGILPEIITFYELIDRLRSYIRLRINSGDYSERALARLLDVSQSHLHNMLKGKRQVNIEFADRAMLKFKISVLDLVSDDEVWSSCDQKNPNWLTLAARRKPAAKSPDRQSNSRTPRRDSIVGSAG